MGKGIIADTPLLIPGCLGLLMQCWLWLVFSIKFLTRAATRVAGFPARPACCKHFRNNALK